MYRRLFFPALLSLAVPQLCHGQLISENYDSLTPGTGIYTGAWSFVYADGDYRSYEGVNGATALNIGTAAPSPAGGGYLSFSTGQGYQSAYSYYNPAVGTSSMQWFSGSPLASSNGHFLRQESLVGGTTYNVRFWRKIEHSSSADVGRTAFSVWNAAGLDVYTPFASTPENLLGSQLYDMATGGWQQVNVTFTAPGNAGDAVLAAFMMGIYDQTTPTGYTDLAGNPVSGYTDYDGNINTADSPPAGWFHGGTARSWQDSSSYYIDGFTLTVVPEPSVTALSGMVAAGAVLRRRRA